MILAIPRELFIHHIFAPLEPWDLAKCALVCKLWHRYCNSNALWEKLTLRHYRTLPENRQVSMKTHFIEQDACLNSLFLFESMWKTETITDETIERNLGHLFYFHIYTQPPIECQITSASLDCVARRCRALRGFSMLSSTEAMYPFTDQEIVPFLKKFPLLERVALSGFSKVSEAALLQIVKDVGRLSSVLFESNALSDAVVEALCEEHAASLRELTLAADTPKVNAGSLTRIATCFRRLQRLHLRFYMLPVSHDHLKECIRALPKLHEFRFKSCETVSDGVLQAIGEHQPLLCSLRLSHCSEISAQGLKFLSRGCPKLQVLRLKGCQDAPLLQQEFDRLKPTHFKQLFDAKITPCSRRQRITCKEMGFLDTF